MKREFKKWIALLLVFTLCISTSSTALAADNTSDKAPDILEKGYVDVVDDQGNIITLWVEEETYYPDDSAGLRATTTHKVGEIKKINVRISNAQIGAVGTLGGLLSTSLKKKLGDLAGKAVVKVIGDKICGNLSTLSKITAAVVALNILLGNEGFNVSVTLEWTHFQHRIQGIDLYDWNLEGVKVTTY